MFLLSESEWLLPSHEAPLWCKWDHGGGSDGKEWKQIGGTGEGLQLLSYQDPIISDIWENERLLSIESTKSTTVAKHEKDRMPLRGQTGRRQCGAEAAEHASSQIKTRNTHKMIQNATINAGSVSQTSDTSVKPVQLQSSLRLLQDSAATLSAEAPVVLESDALVSAPPAEAQAQICHGTCAVYLFFEDETGIGGAASLVRRHTKAVSIVHLETRAVQWGIVHFWWMYRIPKTNIAVCWRTSTFD